MKQIISIDQLQEVTLEQQDKLREWWKPKQYDQVAYTYKYHYELVTSKIIIKGLYNGNPTKVEEVSDLEGEYVFLKSQCLPLLNIGQCIELLINYDPCTVLEKHPVWPDGDIYKWDANESTEIELIDALWEEIKKSL